MFLKLFSQISILFKSEKSLIFVDQIFTSLFNFLLVVLISNSHPEFVADYGLAFSFALVSVGVYKNCAITPFITLGGNFLLELLQYLKLASRSKYVILPLVGLIAFSFYFGITLQILPIVFYFFILEVLKAYSISTSKVRLSILYFIASYIIILSTIYFIPYYLAFILGALPLVVLIVYTVKKEAYKNIKIETIDNHSAFLLTLSFSIYSHGPLWFLYTFIPELTPLFVQLRSFFQPLLVLSRAADLLEKKSAARNKNYNILQVKRVIGFYLLICIPAILSLLIIMSFVFESLYNMNFDKNILIAGILFGILNLLIMISKPLETFFFTKQKLKVIAKTRLIASSAFIVAVPLVLCFSVYQFYILLILMNICWLFMNIVNYHQAKNSLIMVNP